MFMSQMNQHTDRDMMTIVDHLLINKRHIFDQALTELSFDSLSTRSQSSDSSADRKSAA